MFKFLNTLLMGKTARATEALHEQSALDQIDEKVREADAEMRALKSHLATLVQAERTEARLLAQLASRIEDLAKRVAEALSLDRDDLASEAGAAMAQMEAERGQRRDALAHIQGQTNRLRCALEDGHRRMIALRQAALRVRALRRERDMQIRLGGTNRARSAAREAEDLIARVLARDTPGPQAALLAELHSAPTKPGALSPRAQAA